MNNETPFNVTVGGRCWRSEEELLKELNRTLDIRCAKQGLEKERLIDAAVTVLPKCVPYYEILICAIGGADTLSRKGRSCLVSDAYKGIVKTVVPEDACSKCDGSGKYHFASGVIGICYQCNGTGKEK
jgi:hypothetical protein